MTHPLHHTILSKYTLCHIVRYTFRPLAQRALWTSDWKNDSGRLSGTGPFWVQFILDVGRQARYAVRVLAGAR